MVKNLIAVLGVVVLCHAESSAYIDPGSGFTVVSTIGTFVMGFIAIAFGTVALTFKRWISFVKRSFLAVKNKVFSYK